MDKVEELRYLIDCVQREGYKKHSELLKPLDITPNQAEVLLILNDREPLSLKELGELLICEKKSPSRLVNRLVYNGFVFKSMAIDDQRKSVLHLTMKGRKIVTKIKQIEHDFNSIIYTSITEDNSIDKLIELFTAQIDGTESLEKIKKRKSEF
ncbi:MarR family winged helix-turn-helix transcriptional regulator [Mammaliicoccus sciuri]|uniref:MarR family winged helix-turn-helix transcriptional regulator n=1 Tax=Mammaliicoccus sciuri TaxID=1296 RepID=UPI003F571293